MFLHVSVILLTGGSPENPPGPRRTPLGPGTPHPPSDQGEPPPPPDQGEPPRDQAHTPPPGPGTPPDQGEPPPGRTLQHTVNERPVRILLECILVKYFNENTANIVIVPKTLKELMVLSRQCRSGYDVRDDTVKALQHVTLRSLRSKL